MQSFVRRNRLCASCGKVSIIKFPRRHFTLNFEPYTLSPLGHVPPPMHWTFFLIFKLENPARAIPVLEAGVAHLIFHLPLLSGNLATSPLSHGKNNVLQVQPPNSTLLDLFPMLKIKHHPQQYLSLPPNPILDSAASASTVSYDAMFHEDYVPLPFESALANAMAPKGPVLRFQANILEDGIVLSGTFHNRAMAGTGFRNVAEILSKCCQGYDSNVLPEMVPTSLTKEELARKQILNAASAIYTAVPVKNERSTTWDMPVPPSTPKPITRKFFLCEDKVSQLKEMCLALTEDPTMLSKTDIVSAVLWLCVMRASKLSSPRVAQRKSPLITGTDIRTALHPVLPRAYIGNSIQAFSAESLFPTKDTKKGFPGLLDSRPAIIKSLSHLGKNDIHLVAQLALVIRRKLASVKNEYARSTFSRVMNATNWTSSEIHLGEFIQNSLRKMEFYNLDFGPVLGKICKFDIPDPRINRTAYILPARFKNAPWEIRMVLEPELMELIRQDPLFRRVESKEEI